MSEDTLSFNRNKFVGIEKKDEETYLVYGTIEDNLYAHEIQFEFDLNEMKITTIKGHMRRFTTPLCPPAANFLQNAVGLKLGPGYTSKVKREIARPGCRHFGNLLNECLDSIIPSILVSKWREMKEDNPEITRKEFLNEISIDYPIFKQYCVLLSDESPLRE
ncbi:MAG: DUF2889 domain-containing protein [Candidatus Lokiarchaeota archaeon]|nr:DUF2889 domain-containing protein [Candidatus Lokiarchaeota archaeon]